jgi:hypothetical protein
MQAVQERLIRPETGLIQVLDPPFDHSHLNPGYIKGYIPGVRENGGQYTHAAIWTAMAFAQLGEHEKAWELFALINPVHHGATPTQIATYKVEPYVYCEFVDGPDSCCFGQGQFSWMTNVYGPSLKGGLAMGKFTLVGADVHDGSILVKVAVDREAAAKRSWSNDRDGRRAMIADLKRRAAVAGTTEIRFVYEASGLGFGLWDDLTDAGIRCDVLAPTKIERSPHARKQKTDEKDAERLLEVLRGHVLAGNRLPAIWIPDAETRDDRELVRARLDAGEKISGVKALRTAKTMKPARKRASRVRKWRPMACGPGSTC